MTTTGVHTHTQSALSRRNALFGVLLLAGPTLTIVAMHLVSGGRAMPADLIGVAEAVALLFWSPVPFSVTAVIRGDARDRARYSSTYSSIFGPYRALMRDPQERLLTCAELLGLLAAVFVAVLV
jgi:hypothetical protein